jgi:hypothetical protein
MKISEFRKEYCERRKFRARDVFGEICELAEAIVKLDKYGVKEEFSDICVFIQCYLYDNHSLDQNLWTFGMPSFQKFMKRRKIWETMYSFLGINDRCTTCKNYKRLHKVISHFEGYGIKQEKIVQAYKQYCM